ncbi:MAG: ROK family protein [Candidatus Saccharimonadales bacterium]
MYICIDVGGTKTLVAAIDDNGNVVEQDKIATPENYQQFLDEVRKIIASLSYQDFVLGAVGIPDVAIDRVNGTASQFGNLPWSNVSIADDIKKITNCPIYIENDAKLAGLSEAVLVGNQFSKIVYITVSTGIGIAAVENLKIDTTAGDAGGCILPVFHDGSYQTWESFAGGKAIVEKYGKMAKDIDDEDTWRSISKNLAEGLINYIAIFQPEAVIIGGSVGRYFDRFSGYLKEYLDNFKLPFIDIPVLLGATRPDEAVIFGCYALVKQKVFNGQSNNSDKS